MTNLKWPLALTITFYLALKALQTAIRGKQFGWADLLFIATGIGIAVFYVYYLDAT